MSFHNKRKKKPKFKPSYLTYPGMRGKVAKRVERSLDKEFGTVKRSRWNPVTGSI